MFVPLCRLTGHGADVTRGRISPDLSSIATGSADKSLFVWDPRTGLPIRSLLGHSQEVSDLVYHGSGNGLLSASLDGNIRLFDLRCSSSSACLSFPQSSMHSEHKDEFTCVTTGRSANSPLIAAGTTGGVIRFFDLRLNIMQVSTFAHYNSICSLEMSSDDSMLISSCLDGTIRIWSATRGDCLMSVTDGKSNPSPCVFAGFMDGKDEFVGLFLDSSVRHWDLNDRIHSRGRITGPTMTNSTKTFARIQDGIGVPSEDGLVYFLDPYTGKELQPHTKAHADDVLSVDCYEDLMISTGAGEDSSAVLWLRTSTEPEASAIVKSPDYSVSYNLVSPQIEGLV